MATRDARQKKHKGEAGSRHIKVVERRQICFTSLSQFSRLLFFFIQQFASNGEKDEMKKRLNFEQRYGAIRLLLIGDDCWMLSFHLSAPCRSRVERCRTFGVGRRKEKKEMCLVAGGKCVSHDRFKDERRRAFATLSLHRNYSQSDTLMQRQL